MMKGYDLLWKAHIKKERLKSMTPLSRNGIDFLQNSNLLSAEVKKEERHVYFGEKKHQVVEEYVEIILYFKENEYIFYERFGAKKNVMKQDFVYKSPTVGKKENVFLNLNKYEKEIILNIINRFIF